MSHLLAVVFFLNSPCNFLSFYSVSRWHSHSIASYTDVLKSIFFILFKYALRLYCNFSPLFSLFALYSTNLCLCFTLKSRKIRKLVFLLGIRSSSWDIQEGRSKGQEIKQWCILGKWPVGHKMRSRWVMFDGKISGSMILSHELWVQVLVHLCYSFLIKTQFKHILLMPSVWCVNKRKHNFSYLLKMNQKEKKKDLKTL